MIRSALARALPAVGTLAPEFTLRSTAGTDVALSSFRHTSNVLLAFFPLAFTSTCTQEMSAFTDDIAQFQRRDTVVLPISVDSAPTLKEFKAKWKMPFDLLSDFKRVVSKQYGVLDEDKFHSTRAYVVIDKSGTVRWTWEERELRQKRENAELLEKLAQLG